MSKNCTGYKDNKKDNRTGYHIIQSFDPTEKLSAESIHEIGCKLANELYTDYQCVISTHVDKGHIHNHIILSSLNLKTKTKLVDKLNDVGGLYELREVSDKISNIYGANTLPYSKIKSYTSKDYKKYLNISWRDKIKKDISDILPMVENYQEFLEVLKNYGYEIKHGKYTSIKPPGKERFVRLTEKSLGKKYCENSLKDYFKPQKEKTHYYIPKKIKSYERYRPTVRNTLILLLSFVGIRLRYSTLHYASKATHYSKLPNEYKQALKKSRNDLVKIENSTQTLKRYNINNINQIDNYIDTFTDEISSHKSSLESITRINQQYQNAMLSVDIINKYSYLESMQEEINVFGMMKFKNAYENEIKLLQNAYNSINAIYPIKDKDDLLKFQAIASSTQAQANSLVIQIGKLQKNIDELISCKETIIKTDDIKTNYKKLDFELKINSKYIISETDTYYLMKYKNNKLLVYKENSRIENNSIYITQATIEDKVYSTDQLKNQNKFLSNSIRDEKEL